MATKTKDVIPDPPKAPKPAPVNPANDPSKTAEERLAALTKQQQESQR